nr:MAG TPA: hypothetical protein [Caudoviricetes sp.]DAG96295.1 MAG TPA: hypothetical protein [Herelleviridae sp.]
MELITYYLLSISKTSNFSVERCTTDIHVCTQMY